MVIHNASFMMEREREEEAIAWLRTLVKSTRMPSEPALSAMRWAGGEDCSDAEGQTVAMQVELPTVEDAKAWDQGGFAEIAYAFHGKFGPNAVVFTSIFERIKI